MANNPHFSLASRHGMLDTLNTAVSSAGILNIYAGVQPADVSSAVTAANVILATPSWVTNAFAAAGASAVAANAITSDASAAGSTSVSAAWFSICKSTGPRVIDGSVGTAAADLVLNSVMISTGATVAISAFTVTAAA